MRRLIQNFSNEGPETRCQILVLSAKLLSYDIDNFKQAQVTGSEENNQNPSYYDFSGSRISQMYNAVLYLAKYDDEFDIRDRARMISSLFDSEKYEIVSLLLQAPKPTARSDDFIVSARLETHTPEIKEFFRMLPWNTEITEVGETGNDIREGAELKDYNKYKKSFSSQSFITNNSARSFTSSSNAKLTGINDGDSNSISGKGNVNTFTSQNGKKYRLQSLDEFFSDIPERKSKPRKIIKVVEESSDEDEDESEESSDDDEYSDSSLGTSSSGTSSSHLEL